MKKGIKAFTLVELIVSFVIISILSLVVFRTVLSIQSKQIKNISYNSFITFQATINNAIQDDLTNKIIEKLEFCGKNCYDIKFVGENATRLSLDPEKGIIKYGGLAEKLPKNFSFYTDLEIKEDNLALIPEGEYNSTLTIRIPIDSKVLPGKRDLLYIYQFDDRVSAINTVTSGTYSFKYTGNEQTFTVTQGGVYQIELWGAQGGNTSKAVGGKGAYSKGTLSFNQGDKLYLYVGGQNGYNGGGNPGTGSESEDGAVGGGATDVRIDGNALSNRIIVAAGGGGASGSGGNFYNSDFYGSNGGYGGGGDGMYAGAPYGVTPPNASFGAGGAGGTGAGNGSAAAGGDVATYPSHVKGNNGGAGSLGQGGAGGSNYGTPINTVAYGPGSGGGGGGGYYGGGGGGGGAGYWGGSGGSGGGGSSYVSTSGTYIFTNPLMRSGNTSFLSPNGTTEIGHTGNGYIKLTYIRPNPSVEEQYAYNYSYTGDVQTFTAPKTGNYEIQLWGARGGNISVHAATVGKGGYTKGTINLTEGTNLYFYVGGAGATGAGASYNGGGSGESSGGGATDVRLTPRQKYRYVRDYLNGSTANAGNHWVEIDVFDEKNTKISANRAVTGSVAAVSGYEYSRITNGTRDSAEYATASVNGLQYVDIDLGTEYEISKVVVIHYYTDGRTYHNTKTVLYSANRTVSKTIFDSAVSGEYAETQGGKIIYETSNYISRIMVAGGGGGGVYSVSAYVGDTPGHGGGLQGQSAYYNVASTGYGYSGYGGTQTAGGAGGAAGYITGQPGLFGKGGSSYNPTTGTLASSGGGGGYYGGGSGTHPGSTWTGGGGGSSFISGHAGCNAVNASGVNTGQPNHYSGMVFTNTLMIDGAGYAWTTVKGAQTQMPKPDGTLYSLGQGNDGNGYAKIKYIGS